MTDYDDSLLHYDQILSNSDVRNLVSPSELETIDTLILSLVTKKRQKVAYIIGQALDKLSKTKQLDMFGNYGKDGDLLLAQRVHALVEQKKFQAHGDVRAIRFSEVNFS